MILPSDETPQRPEDSEPEDDFAWAQGAAPEELPGKMPDPYGEVQHPAPPGWREDLKRAVLEALQDLTAIEDPAEEFDPPEPPDLFTFYGELSALRNEMRRGQKKLADSLGKLSTPGADASLACALELVHLHDHFAGTDAAAVIGESLRRAGIDRIPTSAGQSFDSAVMKPAGGKGASKNAKVKAVVRDGFTWNGALLRPATVELLP